MKKLNLAIVLFAAMLVSALGISSAQAGIVIYEAGTPNADQGFFTFDDIVATDSTDGVILDTSAGNGADAAGLFGGFGNNAFPITDFDPAVSDLVIEYRFLPGDQLEFFNVVLSDFDDMDSAQDNQFSFGNGNGTLVGDGSGFLTETIALSTPANFQQTSFNFTDSGDSIFNPGLRELQVQSAFANGDALVVEIRSIEIVTAVPEPGSIALLVLAAPLLVLRRRRSA